MSKVPIFLELATVSRPHSVLVIGEVESAPVTGDFVNRKESGWVGYVKSRRWNIREDGSGIDVRIWLQECPP